MLEGDNNRVNADKENISKVFVSLRKTRGLSQEEMGSLLGVSGRTISRWENGTSVPSMVDIMNICREFNLSPNEFFDGVIDYSRKTALENNHIKTNEAPPDIVARDAVFWLFLIHALSVSISFAGTAMSHISPVINCISSFCYIVLVSLLIYKNRNNYSFLKTMAVYSVILALNMFGNYYYFRFSNPDMFVYNAEIAVVNGSIYGLQYIYQDMKVLLTWALTIYGLWLLLSVYFIYIGKDKKQEKTAVLSENANDSMTAEQQKKNGIYVRISSVCKRIIVILSAVMVTLVLAPVYKFTYFSPMYISAFSGFEKYLMIALLLVVAHYGLQLKYRFKKLAAVLNNWFTSVLAVLFSFEYYREIIEDLMVVINGEYKAYCELLPAKDIVPVGYFLLLLLIITSAILDRKRA